MAIAKQQIDLSGKTVLVTGGSMGLGLESARSCLSYGANVFVCARGKDALARAAHELTQNASEERVGVVAADVGDASDVERLFERLVSRFGRCDGVIHAAGVLGPIGSILEIDDPDLWWETLRINLFGTFLVTRAAARRMKAAGGGRIVLYAGGGASAPFPNYTSYACSKVAVVRFTETVAQELAPDVEVNCLAPGFVLTRMHQETLAAGEKAGKDFLEKTQTMLAEGGVSPTIAAEVSAFLVSDAARGITGKFVAAAYDGYTEWPMHLAELQDTDIFTLRRILPRERGMNWQ
jgi:NAD(P)-dependent dehydrogenase (short-subunit alcohol dehydrogenase family)